MTCQETGIENLGHPGISTISIGSPQTPINALLKLSKNPKGDCAPYSSIPPPPPEYALADSTGLYTPNSRLDILFRPEVPLSEAVDPLELDGLEKQNDLSTEWTPLTISIVEAYTPFTTSVVLVAEPVNLPPSIALPERFILKLNDRRCGDRNDYGDLSPAWTPAVEPHLFRPAHILKSQPHLRNPIRLPHIISGPLRRACLPPPPRAARRVSPPSLRHRPASLAPLSAKSDFHFHPATLFVPGLALEHIRGRSMESLTVCTDGTEVEAEVTAHRVMGVVATIQARECSHNDMRLPADFTEWLGRMACAA
ncbi:hypothetical protein C8R44DRAFT_990761 [Mycena epipterygia]|nr:hypothetical protein C8R44DRAFT_990761 [Mycena epipterygia]